MWHFKWKNVPDSFLQQNSKWDSILGNNSEMISSYAINLMSGTKSGPANSSDFILQLSELPKRIGLSKHSL